MKRESILLLSLLFIGYFVTRVTGQINKNQGKQYICPKENTTCNFKMVVANHMTMVYNGKLVYGSKGKLKYVDDNTLLTQAEEDQVMSYDGYFRLLQVIDNQIPGPAIIAYEGQRLIIHVQNDLISDSLSIHWHGMHQKCTPWMDGVGYLTQCPIGPGQAFVYDFTASPVGTFWYHSHVGGQISEGVYGGLIIKERTPMSGYNHQVDGDFIMNVADIHHEPMDTVFTKLSEGNYYDGKASPSEDGPDTTTLSLSRSYCYLIEGKSRYKNHATTVTTETPLTKYSVQPNKKYRFRIIHAGAAIPVRISVDEHLLDVIATDGYYFKTTQAESIILYPGERFDFIVNTKGSGSKDYWIRAASLVITNPVTGAIRNPDSLAILKYTSGDVEPTTQRKTCSSSNRCRIINCAYGFFPKKHFDGTYIDCISVSSLTRVEEDVPKFVKGESVEAFFNFQLGTHARVNGKSFALPGVSSLTQDEEIDISFKCDRKDCINKHCFCNYEYPLTKYTTYQLILANNGNGSFTAHPIHLHGHSFWVLKVSYGTQLADGTIERKDPPSGVVGAPYIVNKDLDCTRTTDCEEVKWKNSAWGGDNIDEINLKNAIRKDTLTIGPGGYAVVRIKADNPGKWFIHCHMEHHLMEGMAVVLREHVEDSPPQPKNFPKCQNFGSYKNPKAEEAIIQMPVSNLDTAAYYGEKEEPASYYGEKEDPGW